MARNLEQRIADLEKTILEFFTGGSQKTPARKTGKTKKATTGSAKKASKARKPRKTSKRKAAQ